MGTSTYYCQEVTVSGDGSTSDIVIPLIIKDKNTKFYEVGSSGIMTNRVPNTYYNDLYELDLTRTAIIFVYYYTDNVTVTATGTSSSTNRDSVFLYIATPFITINDNSLTISRPAYHSTPQKTGIYTSSSSSSTYTTSNRTYTNYTSGYTLLKLKSDATNNVDESELVLKFNINIS